MSFQSRNTIASASIYLTAEPRPSLGVRILLTLALWRERIRLRRCLAAMDTRSLRELGISPAAAAYESGKAFWERPGPLR